MITTEHIIYFVSNSFHMHVLHISYECYPCAKVGGMADVVGALPKYQQELGCDASVIMPRFGMDWSKHPEQKQIFSGNFRMEWDVRKRTCLCRGC